TSDEEIDEPSSSHQLDDTLPRRGTAYSFNHRVRAKVSTGQLTDGGHGVIRFRTVHCRSRTEAFRNFRLGVPFTHGNHTNATPRQDPDEFQTNGPAADDNYGIAGMDAGLLHAWQNSG